MDLNFKRLKQIDDRYQFTVYGYLRRIQHQSSNALDIPINIFYLCLALYFQGDYIESSGQNLKISEDKLTMEHITKSIRQFAFCKQWVDSKIAQIVKWTLKVDALGKIDYDSMVLRLASNELNEYNHQSEGCKPGYAFSVTGSTFTDGPGERPNAPNAGKGFEVGDTLTIVLNTKDRTICLLKNDAKELHIIWTGIKIERKIRYKLSFISKTVKNKITLADFSRVFL